MEGKSPPPPDPLLFLSSSSSNAGRKGPNGTSDSSMAYVQSSSSGKRRGASAARDTRGRSTTTTTTTTTVVDLYSSFREALDGAEEQLAIARKMRLSRPERRASAAGLIVVNSRENSKSGSGSSKNVLLAWSTHFSVLDDSAKVSISYEEVEQQQQQQQKRQQQQHHPTSGKGGGDKPLSPKQQQHLTSRRLKQQHRFTSSGGRCPKEGHHSSGDSDKTPNRSGGQESGVGGLAAGANPVNTTRGCSPQHRPAETASGERRCPSKSYRTNAATTAGESEMESSTPGVTSPRRARKISVEARRRGKGLGLEVRLGAEDGGSSSDNAGGGSDGNINEEGGGQEEVGVGRGRWAREGGGDWGGERRVRDKKPSNVDHCHAEYHNTGRSLSLGELGELDSEDRVDRDGNYDNHRDNWRQRSPDRTKAEEEKVEEEEDQEDRRRWRRRGRAMWSNNNNAEQASRAKSTAFQTSVAAASARSRSRGAQPYHGLYAKSLQTNGIDPALVLRTSRHCRCLQCHCRHDRGCVASVGTKEKNSTRVDGAKQRNEFSLLRRCNRPGCDYLANEWARAPTGGLPDRLEAGRVLDSFNRRAELLGTGPPTPLREKPAWMENPGDPEYMCVPGSPFVCEGFYG